MTLFRKRRTLNTPVLYRVNTVAAALLALQITACAPPTVELNNTRPRQAGRALQYTDIPYARLLQANIKEDRVDYERLAKHRKNLDDYLQIIAATGPNLTPDSFLTNESRLCFYINAYNAGVLTAVLDAGIPESMHDHKNGPLESRYRLVVDGRPHSLGELRQKVEKLSRGDVRTCFALCDAALGSPPLHDKPLRTVDLEDTLSKLVRKAMDNWRAIVAVDHENQALMISTQLATRREDFIRYYKNQTGTADATMLDVVNFFASNIRRQWLNTAAGYTERMIPFNRKLNNYTPTADY